MADSVHDAAVEGAPPRLAREVLSPPRRRRSVVALAIAVALGGAATARVRMHHHHDARHRCPEAELARLARLRAEIQELAAERARLETRVLDPRGFGNLGEADLVEPTRAPK